MNARSIAAVLGALVVALIVTAGAARADVKSVYHGGSYFGDVIVEPDQVVEGDLTVFFGDATIAGSVDGDVNVIGGNVFLQPGSFVRGQINTAGGNVVREVVPWAPSGGAGDLFARDGRVTLLIALDVVVLLAFLIFPVRVRMALDRLEHHPGLCGAAGLVGWVAAIPLAVLLFCTIVLIPLIFLELVALVVGVFIGTSALALLVGRRLYELMRPATTPSPIVALLAGLALLTAAQLVPIVGVLVTLLLAMIGLGATIVAFFNEQSFSGPAQPVPARPPLSGPPMPTG
jgi:hypothetical protein